MANTPNVVNGDVYAVEEHENIVTAMRDMLMSMDKDKGVYDQVSKYYRGEHALPNVPSSARIEVREIVKRSTMNLIPLLVGIPSQICFVDGYRVGEDLEPAEWAIWKSSGMESKQTVAFRTALKYGNAFLSLENVHTKKPTIKLLSTADTVAFYHDPVNDRFPVYAMTIRYRPNLNKPGRVIYYDESATYYYDWHREGTDNEFELTDKFEHRLGVCPVGRLVCQMDDDGRVTGLVEPLIPEQDRVNQSLFDLLVTQTFSSFKVRWASGMMGDPVYDDVEDPDTGEIRQVPRVDDDGNQVYRALPIDQTTWLQTDDPAAKFGTLDETPLEGFLQALEQSIRHFAVNGQLPPHSLMGNMANINADTMVAAMSQTLRFTHMVKTSWNGTISDLLGLAAMCMGHVDSLEDYEGEARWRDMSDNTLPAIVDALGKAATMLQVPVQELWHRYPGITQGEVLGWKKAYEEQLALGVLDEQSTPQGAVGREGAEAPRTSPVAEGGTPPTPLEAFGSSAGAAT